MSRRLIAHAIAVDIIKYLGEEGFKEGVLSPSAQDHHSVAEFSHFFDKMWDRIEKILDKEDV